MSCFHFRRDIKISFQEGERTEKETIKHVSHDVVNILCAINISYSETVTESLHYSVTQSTKM